MVGILIYLALGSGHQNAKIDLNFHSTVILRSFQYFEMKKIFIVYLIESYCYIIEALYIMYLCKKNC